MPEMAEGPRELAGELALGVLDGEERLLAERRLSDEPELRWRVDLWLRHLLPLLDVTPVVTPPASVWLAICGRLGTGTASSSRRHSEGAWLPVAPGVQLKLLHVDPVTGERTGLMRMEPGSVVPEHDHPEPEECYVVEGAVTIEDRDYNAGDYTIARAGTRHDPIRSTLGGLLCLHWGASPIAA